MICPCCGYVNVPGADPCEGCEAALTDVQPPRLDGNVLAESIEADTVASLRPAPPVTVTPTTSVREVIGLLAKRNIGCVLIVFSESLVGIFSERDVVMRIGDRLDEVGNEPIRHFMTPVPETLTAQDGLAYALNRMAVGGFRHIPIEGDEKPVGVVSARDIVAYTTQHFPEILEGTN